MPIIPVSGSAVMHGAMIPLAYSSNFTGGFSLTNIPTSVQDLRIVLNVRNNTSSNATMNIYFNSDVGSGNYSNNQIYTNGVTAVAARNNSQNYWGFNYTTTVYNAPLNTFSELTIDLLNWQAANYKTVIFRANTEAGGSGFNSLATGVWRSSAAITSFNFAPDNGAWLAGSTATVYGIRSIGQ